MALKSDGPLPDEGRAKAARANGKMKRKAYEKDLHKLQMELCRLQDWVKETGERIIILFEGRDAAGKGGIIKAPNRAGVEYVMGFCAEAQHQRFLDLCPQIEKYIVDGGIRLIKVWLEVGQGEQERRFRASINDPLRQWKLSPMDLESYRRWYDYSRARDMMLKTTSSKHAPWHVVHSDDKKRARLNCISHILDLIPYKKIKHKKVKLPKRSNKGKYDHRASLTGIGVVPQKY